MPTTRDKSGAAQVGLETTLPKLQFKETISWRAGRPVATEVLLDRLRRLAKELAQFEQDEVDLDSLANAARDITSPRLLSHKDKGIRAFAACCIVDFLRIFAPNAPFKTAQIKDFFRLCTSSIIPGALDPAEGYNPEYRYVLQSLVEALSIALLNDIDGCEALQVELFQKVFDALSIPRTSAAGGIPGVVEEHITEILTYIVEEAAHLPYGVVDSILAQFMRGVVQKPSAQQQQQQQQQLQRSDANGTGDGQTTLLLKTESEAYRMAKKVCQMCHAKMARHAGQYFSDVLLREARAGPARSQRGAADDAADGPTSRPTKSGLQEQRKAEVDELDKAHRLVREIWRAAPDVLLNVVPLLENELGDDDPRLRQLATETIGDMVSGIGAAGPPPWPQLDPAAYPQLRLADDQADSRSEASELNTPRAPHSFHVSCADAYDQFMGRANDKAHEVRAAWATAAGRILATSGGGLGLTPADQAELVEALRVRLTDPEEKVRVAAIAAVEGLGFRDFIAKIAAGGGVDRKDSFLDILADRCRDLKHSVRTRAVTLLGKLWGVGSGELAAGNAVVEEALGGVPSRLFNMIYADKRELVVLLVRVLLECLVPVGFPSNRRTAARGANGASQPPPDPDALRAERILLLYRSLDNDAKKSFSSVLLAQPRFGGVVEKLLQLYEAYNGGVAAEGGGGASASENLHKAINYIATFLPDPDRVRSDLGKFARVNDRRNYHLVRCVVGRGHDFKTTHRALRELVKRVQGGKEPGLMDTLLPLLYCAGYTILNGSHLAHFMIVSRSDRGGLGGAARDLVNWVSQNHPELLKKHLADLCAEIVEKAPTATRPNEPEVLESLRACATYAARSPPDIGLDKALVRALTDYAAWCRPAEAARDAVDVLLCRGDKQSLVSATALLRRVRQGWRYGAPFFLNGLVAVGQVQRLARVVAEEAEDDVFAHMVTDVLMRVRTPAADTDPAWTEDADLDDECRAKLASLQILANWLAGCDPSGADATRAKAAWRLLVELVAKDGDVAEGGPTPRHHRARLQLRAAQLLLGLCGQGRFDDMLTPAQFNTLALLAQHPLAQVRHGFLEGLLQHLGAGELRRRFYAVVFLAAFEPAPRVRHKIETWVGSQAARRSPEHQQHQQNQQHQQQHHNQQQREVFEPAIDHLISLLAHHPDYSPDADGLVNHATYLLFYLAGVATEANLGLIAGHAERVKQTRDALVPSRSENVHVLCDVALELVRAWQARKKWVFQPYTGKILLPRSLYVSLASHSDAQQIATKQFVDDDLAARLRDLVHKYDQKKKRKSADEQHEGEPAAKKAKPTVAPRTKSHAAPTARSAKPKAKPLRSSRKAGGGGSSSPPPATLSSSSPRRERIQRRAKAHNVSYNEISDDEGGAPSSGEMSVEEEEEEEEAEEVHHRQGGRAAKHLAADTGGDSEDEPSAEGASSPGVVDPESPTPPPRLSNNRRAAGSGASKAKTTRTASASAIASTSTKVAKTIAKTTQAAAPAVSGRAGRKASAASLTALPSRGKQPAKAKNKSAREKVNADPYDLENLITDDEG